MSRRNLVPANVLEQFLPRWRTGRALRLFPLLGAAPRRSPAWSTPNYPRAFSQTTIDLKKGAKREREEKSSPAIELASEANDPHNFSSLESGIEKVLAKLQDELSKLRTGGRFNPELLESVRVHLQKDSKTTLKLGDLAQVVPKGGKSVVVLVGDAAHVKPIVSAIQGSRDLNLQPQQDPHNPLQLNIPIPPPTKESRDQAIGAATKAGEVANVGVRNARGAMQKRLRAMELAKTARPDDIRKAHKDMEKVVEKGNSDVKAVVETARKAMQQS